MVHDAEVARYYFVLQHGAGWYVDPVPVVSDDDDGALGREGGGMMHLKVSHLWNGGRLQRVRQKVGKTGGAFSGTSDATERFC